MSTATGSSNRKLSSNPSIAAESMSESQNVIEINDNEEFEVAVDENEDSMVGSKTKLTSKVWKDFKRVKNSKGDIKAKCNWYYKHLSGETKNGTKHLIAHIQSCPYRRSKMATIEGHGKAPLVQSSLRFGSGGTGKVLVENYTFDQEIARKELANMMVLHEYPLCMVDHAGF